MSKILKIEIDLENPALISICLNEKQIGCIQKFELSVDTETIFPQIKFVFPDCGGYQNNFYKTFQIPIEILQSFENVKVELKKNFKTKEVFEPLDESKFRLLATSSVPIEEIDLSKFDQPKSGSIPT